MTELRKGNLLDIEIIYEGYHPRSGRPYVFGFYDPTKPKKWVGKDDEAHDRSLHPPMRVIIRSDSFDFRPVVGDRLRVRVESWSKRRIYVSACLDGWFGKANVLQAQGVNHMCGA